MALSVVVEGNWWGEDVIAGLQEELGDALFKGAQRVEADARARVPFGEKAKNTKYPRHLRDTIVARKAKKEEFKPGAFVFAGDWKGGVFWHFMVEFGTYFKPAHPFMRPAAIANFNPTMAEAARATQREINRERRVTAKTKRIREGKKR